jgi:hypothetical protein
MQQVYAFPQVYVRSWEVNNTYFVKITIYVFVQFTFHCTPINVVLTDFFLSNLTLAIHRNYELCVSTSLTSVKNDCCLPLF